jgi:hypothetical protein
LDLRNELQSGPRDDRQDAGVRANQAVPMPGERFAVKMSEIKNINIVYISLAPEVDESGELRLAA